MNKKIWGKCNEIRTVSSVFGSNWLKLFSETVTHPCDKKGGRDISRSNEIHNVMQLGFVKGAAETSEIGIG